MTDGSIPTRVLIIDDHQMFADSLGRLLSDADDLVVVGMASDASSGLAMVAERTPDVVLVDYQMPGQDGVETTRRIKSIDPRIQVIMITGLADDRVLVAAIEAGCSGFLTKDRAAVEVADAVRAVAVGEALISPVMLARLLPRISHRPRAIGDDLTSRELQVLSRLAAGAPNKSIASELHLSVNTVRNYVQSVLNKLGAHSKLEAVSTAVSAGIIDYPVG